MLINADNCLEGNRAVAGVLLLYYHLLREGGFTHDQTVYVDPEAFNGFDFVAVEVAEESREEIDPRLLRRGAVIYLLCELNDMVGEFATDYLAQPFTQKILHALGAEAIEAIPEVAEIVQLVSRSEAAFDDRAFQRLLAGVFETYVVAELRDLLTRPPR